MNLERCHASFQAKIHNLAVLSGRTADEIFAKWREYSDACQSSDQSAILWEFVRWQRGFLGGDVAALDKAIR